ncbi:MAG: amino acid adenylation domain-containing protein, partial [Cyclobacteriaceae bacterium]
MKELVKEKLIEKTSMPDNIPLSYTQERLWFLDKIGLGHQYHIPTVLEIKNHIDIDLIERTFQYLVDRHESFRTVFIEEEDVPYQKILVNQTFKVHTDDLRGMTEEQKSKNLRRLIEAFTNEPFDLSTGPLIRVAVYHTEDERSVLAINMHHIISDGWSSGIMTREFAEIYDKLKINEEPELEELSLQYADYTLWQRKTLDGEKLKQDIKHWKDHLNGYEDIDLPTDFPRPVKLSGRGSQETVTLNQAISDQLMEYKKKNGKSSFTILLSGVFALLYYYSRQNSINVGVPMANRMHPQLGNIIGFFANTVINRVNLNPDITFAELIEMVNTEVLRSQDYQHVPFEKIVEAVNPPRDQSRTPLFQVMVNHINLMDKSSGGMEESEITSLESEYRQAKFDLKFSFAESRDGEINMSIEYSRDLFTQKSVLNMLKQFEKVMSNLLYAPGNHITNVKLLSDSEERKILTDYNQTEVPFPSEKPIHKLFEEKAEKRPERTAIISRNGSMTYKELDQQADKIASFIRAKGIKTGDLVAICMDRSAELLVSIMGIMKSGAAYVPIGVENPDQRITYMISDSKTPLIFTDENNGKRINELLGAVTENTPELITLTSAYIQSLPEGERQEGASSEEIAYMIYTSGSTGNPKGVLVPHKGVVNYLYEVTNNYRYLSIDINRLEFAFFGNVSFDATATSFLAPLVSGGTCHVYSPELSPQELLKTAFEDDTINAIKLTPSHLKMLNELKINASATAKMVIIGGEALPADVVKLTLDKGIKMYAINQYGPTECSIASVAHLYNPAVKYSSDVIIGKPLANTQVYILDEHGNPLPHGIPGELYIAGVGVTRGYLGKQTLTDERFVENPVVAGTKAYKTGDLVRW